MKLKYFTIVLSTLLLTSVYAKSESGTGDIHLDIDSNLSSALEVRVSPGIRIQADESTYTCVKINDQEQLTSCNNTTPVGQEGEVVKIQFGPPLDANDPAKVTVAYGNVATTNGPASQMGYVVIAMKVKDQSGNLDYQDICAVSFAHAFYPGSQHHNYTAVDILNSEQQNIPQCKFYSGNGINHLCDTKGHSVTCTYGLKVRMPGDNS